MKRAAFLVVLLLMFVPSIFSAQKRAMTVEDMWSMGRVSQPVLSPDGKRIVYAVTTYSMKENKGNSDLYMIPSGGGKAIQLTAYSGYDGMPRWRPDGKAIDFISARDGSLQIYELSLSGGDARMLASVPTGVTQFVWSPDGKFLAFSTRLYVNAKNLSASVKRDREKQTSKVKARLIDHLFYRYWNHWLNGKRSHVFVMPASMDTSWDVTPGDYDTPPLDLGSGRDFVFSPDGRKIAFVRNTDSVVALSTNNDVFTAPVSGRSVTRLTQNKACDNEPVYSPNGTYLAYRAMKRPGFEADQYDLILYNRKTGERQNLTEAFDLDVGEMVWAPKSDRIYFTTEHQGRVKIVAIDIHSGKMAPVVTQHYNRSLQISPDGKWLYFIQQAAYQPFEIFRVSLKKLKFVDQSKIKAVLTEKTNSVNVKQLTFTNRARLTKLKLNPLEDFWFSSFDGTKVHGLLLKPPFFDPAKKYPLVFLIHGGPQGMWSDDFHYRWNSELFSSPGYVVAMINFRGSKGYGQKFCDAVSKDWGGGPYKDLMTGLDYILKKYDFIDTTKVAAAGASYGGFMIDWIAGHTNRFKGLVTHDGVFDQVSMYGATEELWFPEWEFGGDPYRHPELYHKWSPSAFAKYFKTPTLVIHSQKDFRVPVTQGFQMFTALQRMGVPSKLLYFPDEGHFITKPQNARLWWNTVLGWIAEWINK
ncbi:prolyl tripeptidyl peptidase precursor [bacterium BMS3Bbin03]|nr:prolyl tripeptidyl peptidase precursor [bacterium BMS3Bbin03]